MGSSCELKFDAISLLSQKSYVPDEFVCLFQESDRRELPGTEEESVTIGYFAPPEVVRQRLDLLGYTIDYARHHFQKWLEQERETYREYEEDEGGKWAAETSEALRSLTYEEWLSKARDVLLTRYDFTRPRDEYKDEIERRMRDLQDDWLFYDASVLPIIRSLLEVFPEVREVALDIGALVGGGYIDANEKLCEARRTPDLQTRSDLQPTVILAEGSTDITVLKRSLQRLYPYLMDYFAFFDYEAPHVDGGTSYLVKFLRAFAAARINTNIIAIFDNDAVGLDAFNLASSPPLPANIKVTRLPDIELARSYPTIGPQGEHKIDVNGKAASMELFLGRHNLSTEDGTLTPVIWNNYLHAARQYQGSINDKRRVFERFLEETSGEKKFDYYRARLPELVVLWEHIFGLVREPQREIRLQSDF
jgi:hypothetical protein